MDFDFSEEQKAWRQELRDFIKENAPPELLNRPLMLERDDSPESKAWEAMLREKGWVGIGWPKEYGGLGKSAIEQWILADELMQAGLPAVGDSMVGPTIMRVASDEMKQEWLPKILKGEARLALGYSEPNAGTDLAGLETRAELDGDEFIINGTKIWNTGAHSGTHEWLAVRTDPKVPKHKGISVIIVPIDSPGISIRPIWTWSDVRTNQIFFDNVRVPRKNLVGELNKGWTYIGAALDFERVVIGATGDVIPLFNRIVAYAKETRRNGRVLAEDPIIRNMIAKLAVDLQIARLISLRCAWMIENGTIPYAEASMAKVFNTEFRYRLGDVAMQIMGLYGQLKRGDKRIPLDGNHEWLMRYSVVQMFGGGTNEIQRDIIARRGLGLPRAGSR